MQKHLELWQFIAPRLANGEYVVLLVVAESSGSSPGRAGYKMAVAANGAMCGSIGGGVMEVNLVEQARQFLQRPDLDVLPQLIEQEHRRSSDHPSGMICSGKQTVIQVVLKPDYLPRIRRIPQFLTTRRNCSLRITQDGISIEPLYKPPSKDVFFRWDRAVFTYDEAMHRKQKLVVIGGGHCALALSELAAKLDFRISIFDDRPDLNTIAKNEFADNVTIIESYENIGEYLPQGDDVYVVVVTIGYVSDAVVIRKLIDHDFKYFGVLGSKAKMATLMKELRDEGIEQAKLSRIHTPIGLPINSRTPEEIAVSIAAEMISIRNAAPNR